MVTIENEHFSLKQICESGQCFRLEMLKEWEDPEGRTWEKYGLPAFGRYLVTEQCGKRVNLFCSEEEFELIWKNYFDLQEDYGKIIASIDPEDSYLNRAASFGSGIRILRQDLWEMIISFIISQQNNITRIRRCIDLLCKKYGDRRQTEEGTAYYTFPLPEALAKADEGDLYACNLGYRSRYVRETAASICRGEVDLKAVMTMKAEDAVKELQKLCGVGIKVANCVSLFALHHTDAFPVDTHINKVLKTQYPEGFPFERYPGYAGSLQQYIFFYDLSKSSRRIND